MGNYIRVDFWTAFQAFRNDNKRIACKYDSLTAHYRPDIGQAYHFNENWIALGDWYIVR